MRPATSREAAASSAWRRRWLEEWEEERRDPEARHGDWRSLGAWEESYSTLAEGLQARALLEPGTCHKEDFSKSQGHDILDAEGGEWFGQSANISKQCQLTSQIEKSVQSKSEMEGACSSTCSSECESQLTLSAKDAHSKRGVLGKQPTPRASSTSLASKGASKRDPCVRSDSTSSSQGLEHVEEMQSSSHEALKQEVIASRGERCSVHQDLKLSTTFTTRKVEASICLV